MGQYLKDEVKQGILESANVVFSKYGFNKTTIKMISKHSGVSVGNIYRYFKNKDKLFDNIFRGVYNDIYSIINPKDEKPKNAEKMSSSELFDFETMRVINEFVILFRNNKPIINIVLQDPKSIHYTKTIGMALEITKEKMKNLWGRDVSIQKVSDVEISALANGVIFGAIDIINQEDDGELDEQLHRFIQKIVKGYFLYG